MRRAKQRSALAYALQVIACAAVAALCVRKLFGSVAQRLEDSSTTQAAGNISAKVFAENITKIISAGIPRAGSTFQHVLLCVLANLRASNVTCASWGNPVSPGMVSVDKAHPVHTRYDLRDNELLFLSVRSSVDDWAVYNVTWSRVSYVQIYDAFITCPLCEVENYAKFFNLSNEEYKFDSTCGTGRFCDSVAAFNKASERDRCFTAVVISLIIFKVHSIITIVSQRICLQLNTPTCRPFCSKRYPPAPSHLQTTRPSTGKKLEI